MGMLFGCSLVVVCEKLGELGLSNEPPKPKPIPNGKRWTDKDVALLRELYQNTPHKEIAEKLGRSVEAVRSQAKNLGIQRMSKAGE